MTVPKAMPMGAARRASSQSRSQTQTSTAVRAPHSKAETTIKRMMARPLACPRSLRLAGPCQRLVVLRQGRARR